MRIELTAEQQKILERATQDGSSVEEVLNHAFAVLEDEMDSHDLLLQDESVLAHIEEGCAQADRGELYSEDEVKQMMAEMKARRRVA